MVGSIHFLASLEGQITSIGLRSVGIVGLVVIILLFVASQVNKRWPRLKLPLFIVISGLITATTVFLIGSTVYLNLVSDSGGPVHWHAEIEFWACGSELELKNPNRFLSNKIGSSVLHEHNDKWIHLEGVVVELEKDATIGYFMETVGGGLTASTFKLPINDDGSFIEDGIDGDQPNGRNSQVGRQLQEHVEQTEAGSYSLEFSNGQTCGLEEAQVQVFVYQFEESDNTYKQTKLVAGAQVLQQVDVGRKEVVAIEQASDFVINDNSQIPPGDCIIIEFDSPRLFTDKLCRQYGLKDSERCQEFGVEQFSPKLCYIKDVTEYLPIETEAAEGTEAN